MGQRARGILLTALLLTVGSQLFAADWPMWRRDAARRGSSPEELAETLHLAWVLELPAPRPAWPSNQEKLQFDRLYEPILVGKTLFVPSMSCDTLTAYDSETAEKKWTFYADGPVRFAAAAWKDKVYFTSDDGYLYCLSQKDGALVWKFRGGPSERRILGQERLISSWPARGAPVVYDNKVYFGASIWPFLGIFLHALDAETGTIVWTNSGTGSNYIVQQHHSPAFAGIAPQGYIAATEDRLVVAGGRTIPAVFNRHSGEFIHFEVSRRDMGSKGGGGYEVVAGKDFYLNRGQMYRLSDGRHLASMDVLTITDHAMIGASEDGKEIHGYRPGWREIETKDKRGMPVTKVELEKFWTASINENVGQVFVQSGSRLYARGEGRSVMAIDLPRFDRGARVSWRQELPDEPLNMITGDGKLIVTTDKGRIYCFGDKPTDVKMPTPPRLQLVVGESVWKFHDDGTPPPTGWQLPAFNDDRWPSGPARPSSADGATQLSDTPLTSYFRHEFQLPQDFAQGEELKLSLRVNDGAVVSLNGPEVARVQMPSMNVTHNTLPKAGPGEPAPLHKILLSPKHLRGGKNVVAVEVHQTTRKSKELGWELNLELQLPAPEAPLTKRSTPKGAGADLVENILGLTGVKDGYCLVLGLGNGQVAEEIARQSRLHVIVIDPDRARVNTFRHRLEGHGVYGTRVSAVVADPLELSLPPYMANLVVTEEARTELDRDPAFIKKVFHVLRPHDGVACFPASPKDAERLVAAFEASALDNGSVKQVESFVMLSRDDAPTGSGSWSHQYGDASNAVVSHDTLVKAPLGLLWFGGPSNEEVLPRHGHGPTPHVVAGRLIIEGRHMLRATDIYTGRLLWERKLKDIGKFYARTSHEPGANAIGSNYVSLADGIYVIRGKTCLKLDPATGRKLSELTLPRAPGSKDPPEWGYIGIWKDVLVGGAKRGDTPSADFSSFETWLWGKTLDMALALIPTWIGFESIAQGDSESEQSYLHKNLNKLLLDEDMLARIPTDIRKREGASEVESSLLAYLAESPRRTASDFAALVLKRKLLYIYYGLPQYRETHPGMFGHSGGRASTTLVGMRRSTGEVLWQFKASQQIRHNAIALGDGRAYLVDRILPARANYLKRRGKLVAGKSRVVALDIYTGKELWSSAGEAFGTWLGYSEEQDVLLQAGSRAGDRDTDEVGSDMEAYDGATGEVLWTKDEPYSGPCMLLGDSVITQGYRTPGYAFHIRTGERKTRTHPVSGLQTPWQYTRNYGCNTAIASPNLLTFRSAAAGYYDLLGDSGTGNFGGFRSGCTSNLIPAGGILSAPDYTRTCTCSYQNQSSLALVHMPDVEMWTFNHLDSDSAPVTQLGLNFGAPGDRRGPDGTLWMDYPSVGGDSPDVPVDVFFSDKNNAYVRRHSSHIEKTDLDWVAASALKGPGDIEIRLASPSSLVVPNEVEGGSPLEATNATMSASVPYRRTPHNPGLNTRSLRKGSLPGDLQGRIRELEGLASPSLTATLWTRTDDSSAFYLDAHSKQDGTHRGFIIDRVITEATKNNPKLRVRYYIPSKTDKNGSREMSILAADPVSRNQWAHIAFTYDAATGTGTLYRNGKRIGVRDGPDHQPLLWGSTPPDLRIGSLAGTQIYLDELCIHNRALHPELLLTSEGSPATSEGLVGRWRMTPSHTDTDSETAKLRYTVRLVFAEIERLAPGERVFDVEIDGKPYLTHFDIARDAGGPNRTVVKEFRDLSVRHHLRITLIPRAGASPLLNGVQFLEQTRTF